MSKDLLAPIIEENRDGQAPRSDYTEKPGVQRPTKKQGLSIGLHQRAHSHGPPNLEYRKK